LSACNTGAAAQKLLEVLPAILRNENGPVFAEPWQAQAFAMTVALHKRGLFTWPEWAAILSQTIKTAQAEGDADLGDTYYEHWLVALEALVAAKGIASAARLHDVAAAWDRAAHATPHGQPIDLMNDPRHHDR
jgi:nitrile hydratase accessory protein